MEKQYDARKEFLKIFNILTQAHHSWSVWSDFVTMCACAFSNRCDKENFEEREARYMQIIASYSKQEQVLFPSLVAHTIAALEENPEQDFLGGIFMELNLGDHWKGQVFTPYSVCQLMAALSVDNALERIKEHGYITVNDCACGAGATLIAAIHEVRRQLEKENINYQQHLLITAQDIDYTAAMMCYIQLSLLGVAGYVKVGDTLAEPMQESDNVRDYWFTPIYFSDVWCARRLLQVVGVGETF